MKSTQEIAERLMELFNQGKAVDAERELYAEDVVSHEQDGRTVKGLEEVIAKTQASFAMISEMRKGEIAKVMVNQDTILATYDVDFTMSNGHVVTGTEYGFYKVANGKVVEEYFYM
jgi:ketosteroid isomerase-like protein